METLVDVVGLALVAKVALAVVVQEILVEGFCEIVVGTACTPRRRPENISIFGITWV